MINKDKLITGLESGGCWSWPFNMVKSIFPASISEELNVRKQEKDEQICLGGKN